MEEYQQEVIDEWISGEVIAQNYGKGNLLILTKDNEEENPYSLYRFFNIGNKTVCSVDLQFKPAEAMMKALLALRDIK